MLLLFPLIPLLSSFVSSHVLPGKRTEETSAFNATKPRWQWSPSAGYLDGQDNGAYLNCSGVSTWYTTYGVDSDCIPVLILHGGTGNSNQMYHQANKMAQTRMVILQDTRGQGRSPYEGFTDFHYDDIARDAMNLLDYLNISKVAVVGWSDGAITGKLCSNLGPNVPGLNLAMNYSDRIDRVFAHGANAQWNYSLPLHDPITDSDTGSFDSSESTNGTTRAANGDGLMKRQEDKYTCETLSPMPDKCKAMEKAVGVMWGSEPTWGPEAFAKIQCPTWIVDGDHDEAVARNQADAMAAWTPYAGQLLFPQTGHEALLQDPKFFNFAVEYFLDQKYDGPLPVY